MSDWRKTAKTILTTALVTSAAWLIGGAILYQRMQPGGVTTSFSSGADAGEGASSPGAMAALAPASDFRIGPGGLVIPVAGVRPEQLVDTFNQARAGGRTHDAIDIMAPRGTPVLAAAPGTVEKLFLSARGGNTVYVRAIDRRLQYYYAHLDSYAPGLAAGLRVRAGDVLGRVGSTGSASPDGPHLHFEIQRIDPAQPWYRQGGSLNPYPLLAGRR